MMKNNIPDSEHTGWRSILFSLLFIAVLLFTFLAAYRDGTGFDVVRRYITYGNPATVGKEAIYQYENSSANRFAVLEDTLVVLSNTSLQILHRENGSVYKESISMTNPALVKKANCVLAYDVGGTELRIVKKDGPVFSLTTDPEEPILSASLSEKGFLALVTGEKTYYKSSVSVYDGGNNYPKRFQFNSHNRFVSCAQVLGDSTTLAAVTMGQDNSILINNVILYNINEEESHNSYTISDGLILDIGEVGEKITTVCDNAIYFTSRKGEDSVEYSYNGAHLRNYTLDGNGYAALLLNRYRSGSVGRLVTVSPAGEELGSLDISEEVQGISASGRYLAILYVNRIEVYNETMSLYSSLNGLEQAQDILVQPDGSILILSASSAKLFLP